MFKTWKEKGVLPYQVIIAHQSLEGKNKVVIGFYLGEVSKFSHLYTIKLVYKRWLNTALEIRNFLMGIIPKSVSFPNLLVSSTNI